MATNNTRDVRMQLSVETLGEEGIAKLGAMVRELAKQGGDAAPEFTRLADEIDRLNDQAKALAAFQALADETTALAAVQERTAAATQEVRTRLDALSAASEQARASQAAVRKELEGAAAAYRGTRDALATLNAETTGAARKEAEYVNSKRALLLAAIDQRQEQERLRAVLSESNATVKAADTAERALAASYTKTAAEADKTARALQAHTAALAAAQDAALDLGVVTENTAEAQAEIASALANVGAAAEALQDRVARLAQQERDLSEIRAFEKLAEESRALMTAAQYASLFDEAMERAAASQRNAAAAAAEAQWQQEAFKLVEAAEAAQRLARETEVTAAAMRELAAIDAFEKQAAAARQMMQSAEYVAFWRKELERADTQAAATAEEAERASQRIKDAFGTIGQRSAADLAAEIAQVRAALTTIRSEAGVTGGALSSAFAAGQNRLNQLERELRAVNGQLTAADRLAGLFKNSLGQITAGNIIADGVGYLVNKVKEMGVAFVAAIVQIDQLRRGLTAVYGSALTAAAQIVFLKNTANAAGVAFGSISQAFVKFSAATRSANIGLTTTNELFAAVTRTASTLGLSGEEVTGMLEALGQMASKGTVSLEELRQQLGDRLPGAISLTAQGLGLSEAALIKLVESGGLAARDLFPALTRALNTMKGSTDGLVPSWERLKNALTEAAQTAGDAGWSDVLIASLKLLATVLGLVILPLTALTEVVFGLAKAMAAAVNPALTWSEKLKIMGEIADEAAGRQSRLTAAFDAASGGVDRAATAQARHNERMVQAGTAAAQLTAATTTTTAAQQAQAFATKVLADNTIDLGSKMVQIKANIDELLSSQIKDTDAKAKLVQAAKLEGDALTDLAKLRGDESAALAASLSAQERSVSAITNLATAHRTETELLQLKLTEVKRIALAQDGNLEGRKQEIAEIEKKISVSRAETEQSKQAEAQARAELQVRQLQVQTYRDNSARLGEYANAVVAAGEAVRELERRHIEGRATEEQVVAARQRHAAATHLYNDALRDTINSIDLENRAKQASINVSQARLSVEQQSLLQQAALFRSLGDLASATEFEILAKYKQIEATRLAITAKKAEAEATIAAANAELKALNTSDALYEQKRKEIEIRLENAKAKMIEAQAGESTIAGIQREIDALRNQAVARGGSVQSIDRDTQSRNTNTAAIGRQTAAMEKQRLTADGFKTNKDGSAAGTFNNNLPVDRAFALANGEAMSIEEAAAAFQQAKNAYEDMQSFARLSPGAASVEYQDSTRALYNSARAQYERMTAAQVGGPKGAPSGSVGGSTSAAPGAAPLARAAPTKTINIVMGGRTVTASGTPGDMDNLEGMLQQLATGKGTAR